MRPTLLLCTSMLLAAAGCGAEIDGAPADGADAGAHSDAGPDLPDLPEDTTAVLEIYALDIWAQPLPAAGTALEVTSSRSAVEAHGFPIARVGLEGPASYEIALRAADHRDLDLQLVYDGSGSVDGLQYRGINDVRHGLAIRREVRQVQADLPPVPVYTVYLGAAHEWFSSVGRPARRGNDVSLLMDGEQAWSSVYDDLIEATHSVLLATWWWESTFELVREGTEHITLSDAERRAHTILGVLEAIPATKRVIVAQFLSQDGLLDWATSDAAVRAHGSATGDAFEFMGQANETAGTFRFDVETFSFGERVRSRAGLERAGFDQEWEIVSDVPGHDVDLNHWPISVEVQHASYHQKFAVIDDQIAYIGGMNLRKVDWDSSEHRVFDHRRMQFDASEADRWAVYDHEALPDQGPRKDYMVRIDGPAAQDAADVFKQRWDLLRYEEADYSENTSAFEVDRDLLEVGDTQVQVTTTLPDPLWEHSIAETWLNAVSNAEEYILIEDQYFRAPILNEAIAARMQEVPDLRLIVITKPINEWLDPGCAWTYLSNALFETLFPGRYMLLQLRAFDTEVTWGWDETESRFQDMDVHSKLLIVDDRFMSVGSANKNNRGMIYEGEMSAAVLDDAWVRTARRRIIGNMLPPGTAPADDVAAWSQQLRDAANWNQYVYDNWDDEGFDISLDGDPLPVEYTPAGFVYPLDFRAVEECLIEDVGPDMT